MLMVASKAVDGKKRIYHRCGCMYARRIKADHRLEKSGDKVKRRHYRECKFCAGLQGDVNVHKNAFDTWSKKENMTFTYRKETDTLYIRTEVGFWKVFVKKELNQYLLYHRNAYSSGMDWRQAANGTFHRQSDVPATESLGKIVGYVAAHDRAKVTIMDDYRKLPRQTKRQKKYYRAAEKREKRNAGKRLDSLFVALENSDPDMRKYSFC